MVDVTINNPKHLNILLWRYHQTDKSTVGKLFLNEIPFCFTMEDVIRPEKIKHETAIDAGKYQVQITYSPKYKTFMPLLINVPKFSGIRIHSGNTHKDTSGCILVGYKLSNWDFVGQSRNAYRDLMTMMKSYESYSIEIVNIIDDDNYSERLITALNN